MSDAGPTNVVDLETARIMRLPMLDVHLHELQDLVSSFVNQCVALGFVDLASTFSVGKFQATIDLKIVENNK